jgi:hypothetical protein
MMYVPTINKLPQSWLAPTGCEYWNLLPRELVAKANPYNECEFPDAFGQVPLALTNSMQTNAG